ncbi:hypothetical protein SAMN04488513_12015 [Pseudozobellia thermophila]|uniref:Uncharacterized protein n=1 Tax=Pseudozobellia thermophila TaxID=192903 RepID=A0A1M6PE56_9FLAO|nr:hypothetical protein SAMN04488513_12015 [Pseudozobellia thermophila]
MVCFLFTLQIYNNWNDYSNYYIYFLKYAVFYIVGNGQTAMASCEVCFAYLGKGSPLDAHSL